MVCAVSSDKRVIFFQIRRRKDTNTCQLNREGEFLFLNFSINLCCSIISLVSMRYVYEVPLVYIQ